MGQSSSLMKYLFSKPEKLINIYGLDGVGKTEVFNKMPLDSRTYPMPTPHVCEGIMEFKEVKLWIVDYSSKITLRNEFFSTNKCDAVILVVDSTDLNHMNELNEIMNDIFTCDILKSAIFLVFANKQDLSNALKPADIAEKIKLKERNRVYHIVGTSGLAGEGIKDGLEWLHSSFCKKKWFNIF